VRTCKDVVLRFLQMRHLAVETILKVDTVGPVCQVLGHGMRS
jgi:hypothetical protein